jgi:hypothetical protein
MLFTLCTFVDFEEMLGKTYMRTYAGGDAVRPF